MDKPVVLEAEGLTRAYRQGERPVEVLHGLDLAVHPGEFITVLGPSGSGKSTLLNLLGLMARPTSGDVLLDGEKTAQLTDSQRAGMRAKRIGFIFQFDSLLPEFSLLENIVLPGRIVSEPVPEVEQRAKKLMNNLGIFDLSSRFPHQMSGGERQRGAIARALINRPGVLLADEPTGNLDRRNGELVCSMLRELSRSLDVAVVMVTHNEHAAESASRVIHLIDGRINRTEVA